MKKWICMCMATLLLVLGLGLGACSSPENAADKTLFTLNGEKVSAREYGWYLFYQRAIFETEYGLEIWNNSAMAQSVYDLAKEQAFTWLLDTKVGLVKANEQGIALSDEDFAAIKESAQGFIAEMKAIYGEDFFTIMDATEADIEQMITENFTLMQLYDSIKSSVTVDEAAFAEEYAQFLTEGKVEYLDVAANVIQLGDLAAAEDVIRRLGEGEDFTALMQECSLAYDAEAEDPNAAIPLSVLGLGAEDAATVINMVPGTVSGALENYGGFVVIKVISITEPNYAELEAQYRADYTETLAEEEYATQSKTWINEMDYERNEAIFEAQEIPGLPKADLPEPDLSDLGNLSDDFSFEYEVEGSNEDETEE